MLKAKCIEKIRDENNHIIGYKIVNKNGKVTPVKPDELKKAIKSGQLEVINLTLTSDNRLIDKKPDTPSKPTTKSSSKQNINIESVINKAKSMGYTVNTFDTDCKHKCYIASSPDNKKHLLIIPDNVKYIYDKNVNDSYTGDSLYNKDIYNHVIEINGTLKVIGGKNLTSTRYMFFKCRARSLDLSSFDTSKVTDMYSMFEACKAQYLDLSSFNTSNVTNMRFMFKECTAQSINLSSFDTSNVETMNGMFMNCEAQSLDLTSFDTHNVEDMAFMFEGCKAQSIDLRSFNTSNVTSMSFMFFECKAKSLDLSSFNTSKVKVGDMLSMFYNCEADIKVNDSKLKRQLEKDKL